MQWGCCVFSLRRVERLGTAEGYRAGASGGRRRADKMIEAV